MNAQGMHAPHQQVRDGYAILGALRRRGENFSRLAREMGLSHQLVRDTAHGKFNNRRVLQRMLDMGIPPDILHLPPDLRGTQGTAA